MPSRLRVLSCACLFLVLSSPSVMAQLGRVAPVNQPSMPKTTVRRSRLQSDPAIHGSIADSYGNLPMSFEANRGQMDAKAKFLSRGSGYTLFLTGDEAVFSVRTSKPNSEATRTSSQLRASAFGGPATQAVLRMKLVEANLAARITGADELPGKSNYFIGNDPKKWHSSVPTFEKVKYEGIYPGIDLVYYGNQRRLEYDFVVAPGANPRRIVFDLKGAENIRQDKSGDLVLKLEEGETRWRKPVVYQKRKDGTKQRVGAHYSITNEKRVRFKLARYDAKRPLYIDPLIYSTYLGGNGFDSGSSIAVDSEGNAYVTGTSFSTNFPTLAPLQASNAGGYNAFVTKINPSGSALVFSTYLGGSCCDQGLGITVDSADNVYVAGGTQSTDFPTTPGAFQPVCNGGGGGSGAGAGDAFVAKINTAGSALVYSTCLGGGSSDLGQGIAVDSSGNAYVTGQTCSTDFPITPAAFQQTYGGGGCAIGDAFVSKLNSGGSSLLYSSYLGGSYYDYGTAIALDGAGDAYITGVTYSGNFPTVNALQPTFGGEQDAFVSEINPSGSALIYSTYLGGSGQENGFGIAVDNLRDAYVTGMTTSTNFPTVSPFQSTLGGIMNAFVSEVNPSGSALVYSTYLGGSGEDLGLGIAVDGLGDVYVTGGTTSTDFPTMNPFQPAYGGNKDAFVTKINSSGSALVYSSYLGGDAYDETTGIGLDSTGNAYVVGSTSSTNFPTINPLQASYGGGGYDAVVAKIDILTLAPLNLSFGNQAFGTTSSPQVTTLTNTGAVSLTITSIGVTGLNSGDFAQSNNCGTSVPANGSCGINVTFKPTGTGSRNAAVSFADSAASSPQTVALTGFGVKSETTTALVSSLNPSNFAQSVMFTVTVTPQGLGNPTGTVNFFDGPTILGSSYLNSSGVATFATSGLTVGTHSITATYNGDTNFGSGTSPVLSQVVQGAIAQVSPTSLNFGNQTVGIASASQKVTLINTGNIALTISSIGITGTNTGDFGQLSNCGASVSAGGSCTISVTFMPTTTGTRNAALSIADNAPGSPQSASLTGVGVAPAVLLSPSSLTFPTQVVFTTSPSQSVTLTNPGAGLLIITKIAVTGQFSQANTCGTGVAAGGSCTISVKIRPSVIGALKGSVSITDNAVTSPQSIPLTGTGTYVQFTPTRLNFGNQPVGTKSLPKKIILSNKGSVAVSIAAISIAGSDKGDFSETNTCDRSVKAGGSCSIVVTFKPSAKGGRSATVSVTDNGGGSPQKVGLAGTGT